MEEVEKSIIKFCERQSKNNHRLYLFDIVRHLRNGYGCTIRKSILIIDKCVANEYLEINEIEWKK